MRNLPESKYDENGRPIKKGLFSHSPGKRTYNYSKGDRESEHNKKHTAENSSNFLTKSEWIRYWAIASGIIIVLVFAGFLDFSLLFYFVLFPLIIYFNVSKYGNQDNQENIEYEIDGEYDDEEYDGEEIGVDASDKEINKRIDDLIENQNRKRI